MQRRSAMDPLRGIVPEHQIKHSGFVEGVWIWGRNWSCTDKRIFGDSKYNQKNSCHMSKILDHESFFRKPSGKQCAQILSSQFILESFCKETVKAQGNKKLVLTDSHIAIMEQIHSEYQPTLLVQLNDRLRFQRIPHFSDLRSKTVEIYGFHLHNQHHQTTTIYLQFSSVEELWLNYLAKVLIQTGFHYQYEVVSKIGCGSSASVCSVRRLRDGEMFAAKVFPKSTFAEKPQKRQCIMNEIQILRVMDHQHIAKIVHVMESQTSIFMITEHFTGGNLFERLNKNRGINQEQTKKVMRGLLKALDYMHGFGVMHRDIKLQNVMLRSPDSWEPVLVDFGLAAISDQEPYYFYRCGTPGYIAPQIISMRDKQHIDVVCDIFSAGALFHILLTSCYLFGGANNEEVYKSNKALEFDLTSERYSKIDQRALKLLKAMLELDPEERITAEECLQLQYLQDDEPVRQRCEVSPAATEVGFDQIHYQF